MDANECKKERFSSRSIGLVILAISMLLLIVGLVVLPVVGFIFAIPLLILGIAMIAAPESRACQLIREGLRIKWTHKNIGYLPQCYNFRLMIENQMEIFSFMRFLKLHRAYRLHLETWNIWSPRFGGLRACNESWSRQKGVEFSRSKVPI